MAAAGPAMQLRTFGSRQGNFWIWNLATFTAQTLSSEKGSAVLSEELSGINWDIIELGKVRRTGEGFMELTCGHILCYRGH